MKQPGRSIIVKKWLSLKQLFSSTQTSSVNGDEKILAAIAKFSSIKFCASRQVKLLKRDAKICQRAFFRRLAGLTYQSVS